MKFDTSNKSTVFGKKPHIKRGYYAGKLTEVKPRQREDGVPIEGKYGKQIVLLWEVYSEDKKERVMIDGEPLVMASVCNSEYKQEDGTYRTAFTKNSRVTEVFEALGWEGPDGKNPIDTDKFVGKWAVLNIDDYDATFTDENGKDEIYKASAVKDVSKDESISEESVSSTRIITSEDPKIKELANKLKFIKGLKDSGSLTDDGYLMAKEQLELELHDLLK